MIDPIKTIINSKEEFDTFINSLYEWWYKCIWEYKQWCYIITDIDNKLFYIVN